MFLKKLNFFFLVVVIIGSTFLVYSWYSNYSFKNNPLDEKIINQIKQKQIELQKLAFYRYGVSRKIPIKISDKMPQNLFGAASINKAGDITIFLNKKRFQESIDYMIDDVLPHEYAHALMFVFKEFSNKDGGHTKKWQEICKNLNGLRCNRFVNHNDIIIGKTTFF